MLRRHSEFDSVLVPTAFDGDAVVSGDYVTVFDQCVCARIWIDTVGVGNSDGSKNGDGFDNDAITIDRMNIPRRRIDQCDVRDLNVFGEQDLDQVRSCYFELLLLEFVPPILSLSVDRSVVTSDNHVG